MPADDRTEAPTAKHRREAREKGSVARSQDLSGAAVTAAGLAGLAIMGPGIVRSAGAAMTEIFSSISRPSNVTSGAGLDGLFHIVESTLLRTVAPVAGLCLVIGLALNFLQVGLRFSPKAIVPDVKRLNPVTGAKNLFGPRMIFEAAKSIAKVAIVGIIVAVALIPDMMHPHAAVGTSPGALGSMLRHNATGIAMRAAGGYLLIGAIDFAWQRRQTEKGLKMTKQQVRDEMSQQQLPTEVRTALRRRQRQQAKARMMAAVPHADVVITNPTHFAVALEYNGEHPAPVVIAKGQDQIALQIRRIAAEHDVPIIENPPLARQLHKTVAVDQMINADLYQAVAEVLAYVYRLAARRRLGV